MHIQSLRTIYPDNTQPRLLEYAIIIAVNISAILTALFLPLQISLSIFLVLLFSFVLILARIHIIQIMILSIILGFAAYGGLAAVFEKFFYMIFAFMIFYYFARKCLSGKLFNAISDHHIIAGLFFLLGCLAFVSLIVNSRFTGSSFFEAARVFSFVPLFLIIYYFLQSKIIIKNIVVTLFIVSLIIAIYSYLLLFSIGFKIFLMQGISFFRISGFGLGNANAVASAIGFSIPLMISYIMFAHKNKMQKHSELLCFLLIMIIWILWNSRSSYLYVFFSLLFLIGFHKKRLKYYFLILLAVIIGLILVLNLPVFQEILRLERGLSHRDQLWQAAINIIRENPFWGTGPDSFWRVNYYYMDPSFAKYAIALKTTLTAHNLILWRTAELGIGAAFIILAYWIFVMYKFYKKVNIMKKTNYYYIYLGCGATFFGLIIKSLFESAGNVIPLFFVAIILKLPKLVSSDTA